MTGFGITRVEPSDESNTVLVSVSQFQLHRLGVDVKETLQGGYRRV
jgi:hypothetical protein